MLNIINKLQLMVQFNLNNTLHNQNINTLEKTNVLNSRHLLHYIDTKL